MRNLILAAAAGAASLTVLSSSSHAALAYALTDENALISFDTSAPTQILSGVTLRTAANGPLQDLIGIDIRPSNNTLYGVSRFGQIYTLDPATGIGTPVSQLSTTLSGSRFGIDFNPAADLLRIVSNTDQNLRVNVGTGVATTDTALNPGNPNVTAVAYSNNDNDASTPTTLYAIDVVTDQLMIQNPPNAGTLTTQGGTLGVDVSSINGFDIATSGQGNLAFAALQPASNGVSQLYSINLTSGAATLIGTIGGGDIIDGLAVTIPEPGTLGLLGGVAALLLRRRAR